MKMIKRKKYIGRLVSVTAMLLLLPIAFTFAESKTWTSVRGGTWQSSFLDVYFTDPQHGWIVGSKSTILSTQDGGKTWKEQSLPFEMDLHKVHFVDTRTGWIAGDNGTVLKTMDGGATWSKLMTGTHAALSSLFFIDQQPTFMS